MHFQIKSATSISLTFTYMYHHIPDPRCPGDGHATGKRHYGSHYSMLPTANCRIGKRASHTERLLVLWLQWALRDSTSGIHRSQTWHVLIQLHLHGTARHSSRHLRSRCVDVCALSVRVIKARRERIPQPLHGTIDDLQAILVAPDLSFCTRWPSVV
jgi:hypothetical protein